VVTRRSVAGLWKWEAVFTCRVPADESAHAGAPCGIDIGWRQTARGLRVAVVASTQGINEIILAQPIIDRALHLYDLISKRHRARRDVLQRLERVDWGQVPLDLRRQAELTLGKREARH
jgi:hypothetical protein